MYAEKDVGEGRGAKAKGGPCTERQDGRIADQELVRASKWPELASGRLAHVLQLSYPSAETTGNASCNAAKSADFRIC